MRLEPSGVVWLCLLVSGGCGDDGPPVEDAGGDADASDARDSSVPPISIAPPAPPMMTPCPPGWREVIDAEAVVYCAPYAETGIEACGATDVHLPGRPGCERLGPPCPSSGEFPAGLPSGRSIVYARSGAVGGDGTESAPFGDLATAVEAAPAGAIVAVAAGDYTEEIIALEDVDIWGACTDGVVLTGTGMGGVIQVIGATATIRNLTFRRSVRGLALTGSDATLEDVAFVETMGPALTALNSGLVARRVLFAGPSEGATLINGGDARFEEIVVTGPLPFPFTQMAGTISIADSVFFDITGGTEFPVVFVDSATDVTIERSAFIRITPVGARLQRIDSLAIRDTYFEGPAGTVTPPTGLVFGGGVDGDLERITLVRPRDVGIGLAEAPTTIRATDVVVIDAAPSEVGDFGYGIGLVGGTSLTLSRTYVARASGVGVLVDGRGSSVTATDLVIDETRPNSVGVLGRAVQAQAGGRFSAERARFTGNREVTVVSANTGTEVELSDVEILTTGPRGCAPGCSAAGFGVGAYEEGRASLVRFRLGSHALAGAQIATDGAIDLSVGEVLENPVGVNVQVEGYDLGRLGDRVEYRNNGVNLDSESLPVPPPAVSGL